MFDMKTFIPLRSGNAKAGLAAILCIAALVGVGSTTSGQKLFSQFGVGESFAQTTEAAGRILNNGSNAVQAFLGRSPGERGAIDILKGKSTAKVAAGDKSAGKPKPSQRALGKTFDDPLVSLAGPILPAPAVEFLPLDAEPTSAVIPAVAISGPGGSGGFSPGFGGGGFIGGGGGGGSGGEGVVPPVAAPPILPPVAAPVPEPSTWILLLMGFAVVGSSLRRKNATQISKMERAGNCVAV